MALPNDFNWIIYLDLNEDLKSKIIDKIKAEKHYLKHGIRENRKYKVEIPSDFDWKLYLDLNKSLKEKISTEENAKKHYIKYGFKEKRNYKVAIPSNFDWTAYLSINPDVKEHQYDTEEKAKFHYLNYGFFENRTYLWSLDAFQFIIKKEDCLVEKLIGDVDTKTLDINTITSKLNIKDYLKDEKYTFLEYNSIKNLYNNVTDYCKNKLLDLYVESFILIIDFPNLGGGAQQFMNAIISNYKKNNNFLIIRNNNDNSIEISVNDNYVLNTKMDVSNTIHFIESNKHKINKIFINHISNHSFELLDKLFQIGKEVTTITHDYFLICYHAQPYYHEISTNLRNNSYITKCNNIITQNKNNLIKFQPFISNSNIIISPLPDLRNSLHRISTNNTKIVLGVIGSISKLKGANLIHKLIQLYENNENIEIIVFGKINLNYPKCFQYKDIYELNELLVTHKPNLLLETSLWPETYCYTLTLAMLTQLPILSLKKKFNSVIEDRLSSYNKTHFFRNIHELENLIFTLKKQDYFFTIDPKFHYNSFWDSYFLDSVSQQEFLTIQNSNDLLFKNIKDKNIILITSKIYVSNQTFSYTSRRSIYSAEERFIQTIETIQSIRDFIPDAYIILFDNSVFPLFEKTVLSKLCDCFINIVDDDTLNYFTDENKIKAYADISQQVAFLDLFISKAEISLIKHFFKLSGRYLINKDFNYQKYDNNKNVFKRNLTISKKDYFYTCFYKLEKSFLPEYHKLLKPFINGNKDQLQDIDCEILLPKLFSDKITEIPDSLGITQRVAVWNDLSNI